MKARGLRRNSLNRYFNWRDLLALLGEPTAARSLPAVVRCPLCRGSMQALYDICTFGAWFRCFGCAFRGDSLMLAAAKWGVPYGPAALRAISLGVPIPEAKIEPALLEVGLDAYPRRYGVCDAMFAAASRAFPAIEGERFSALRELVGASDHALTIDRWTAGAGRYVGAIRRIDFMAALKAAELLVGESLGPPYRKNRDISDTNSWKELLLIPSWDLPGRIAGFALVSWDGSKPATAFKRVVTNIGARAIAGKQYGRAESGLFMYPAVMDGDPSRDDAVFAIDDHIAAAQLHVRHDRDNPGATLPLAAYWSGPVNRPLAVWDQFRGRDVYLWSRTMSDDFVHQAYRADAKIVPMTFAADRGRVMQGTPDAFVDWMRRNAVDWRDEVRRWLQSVPYPEAEALASRLRLPEHEIAGLCRGSVRLPRMIRNASAVGFRRAFMTDVWVTEQDGRWAIRGGKDPSAEGSRPFTDFVLRIHTAISCPDTRRVYASGEFIHEGEGYPFLSVMNEVGTDVTHHWVLRLLKHFSLPRRPWNRISCELIVRCARLLYKPREITTSMLVGWSSFSNCFVFPGYQIEANGDVTPREWMGDRYIANDRMPCRDLGAWHEMTREDFARVSAPGPHAALYWAIAALLVGALIACHVGAEPRKVGMAFGAAEPGLEILARLGCVRRRCDEFRRIYYEHRWPVALDAVPRDEFAGAPRQIDTMLHHEFASNHFVGGTDVAIASRALSNQWDVLIADPDTPPKVDLPVGAEDVIPNYLRHFAMHRLLLPGRGDPVRRILEDMAEWVGRNGGDAKVVRSASRLILRAGSEDDWRLGLYLASLLNEDLTADSPSGRKLRVQKNGDFVLHTATTLQLLAGMNTIRRIRMEYDDLFLKAGLARDARTDDPEAGPHWRMPRTWLAELVQRFGVTP